MQKYWENIHSLFLLCWRQISKWWWGLQVQPLWAGGWFQATPGNQPQGMAQALGHREWRHWENLCNKGWKMMNREEGKQWVRNSRVNTVVREKEKKEKEAFYGRTHPLKPMEDPHWIRGEMWGGRRERWPDQNLHCLFPLCLLWQGRREVSWVQ